MSTAGKLDSLVQAKAQLQDYGLTKIDETRALLLKAREEAQQKNDVAAEIDVIRVLVDVHVAKKQHSEAINLVKESAESIRDGRHKADLLILLAQVHLGKDGGWHDAMSALSTAQTLHREAGNSQGEVEAMGMAAQLHFEGGDTESALRVARDALAIAPDATSMHTIAQVQLSRGNAAAATEQATEMLALCQEKENKAGQASASLTLTNAIFSTDETSMEGLRMGRQTLALFQEVGDVYGTQSALHTLANGYFSRCDLEEGLKCAREALACCRQTGDEVSEETLKAVIEEARVSTAEYRKYAPKRPFVVPPSAITPRPAGPSISAAQPSLPPMELEAASANRGFWGVPTQAEADPSVDAADRPPSHSVIWGTCLSDNVPTQVCVEFADLLACMQKGDVPRIPIVVLTSGVFGRQVGEHQPASMTNVSAATIWGMARTARQEMPTVIIQMLDFSEGMTAAEIPRTIRPQLMESAYYHKARWEPQIAAVPSLFRRELKKDNLTTGGPGGNREDESKKQAKYMRRSFNWMGPSHKLDYCWYRQEWRACGPAFDDIGPMPPPPPCRALRTC